MLFSVAAFFAVSAIADAASFGSVRDIISSLKAGNTAMHTVQFSVTEPVSTSTISINFSNVVSSTNAIDASHVRLSYGLLGNEVEYPIAATAGNGVWGFAISTSTKMATLTYPTSNGFPIAAGDAVTVTVGNDPTPLYPFTSTSTSGTVVLPTITSSTIINIVNTPIDGAIASELLPPEQQPQNIGEPGGAGAGAGGQGQGGPQTITIDFQKARQGILEQLQKIRTFFAGGGSGGGAPQGGGQAQAPVAVISGGGGVLQGGGDIQETPAQPVIALPPEKSTNVDPASETLVTMRRDDGAGLDVLLPQQVTLTHGTAAREEVPRQGSLFGTYTVDVKPVTVEQAKSWATLPTSESLAVAPAQVYIVTAYRQDSAGISAIQTFLNPVKYVFRFTEEEIQGIDKTELSGYSWNGTNLQKEESLIDMENNTVTISANHLTIFMLAGPKIARQKKVYIKPSVTLIPVQSDVGLDQFGLVKEGEQASLYQTGGNLSVTPNTKIFLCIPSSIFKKYPKNLQLTLASQATVFSYDAEKRCYAANLTTPKDAGTRVLSLRIVYLDDQVQTANFRISVLPDFQVKLISLVTPSIETIKKNVETTNKQIAQTVQQSQPALQTTAIAVGPVAAAVNPGLISNSINWYHYLNHFISAVLSALGLRRRRRPWGVVYDSISKNPVDLAIVRLFEAASEKLVETQVTDKLGRFSFLVKPGRYTVSVLKNPYAYPSTIVKGALDGDYQHVYHQEPFELKSDADLIELSIPLDPQNPKEKHARETFVHSVSRLFSKYAGVSLVVSMAISIVLAVYAPTPMNVVLLFGNSVFAAFRAARLLARELPWGTVFDSLSFEPIPLASIGIVDAKEGKLLRTRLSDYEGRFGFLVPSGEYLFTVAKEQYQFPPAAAPKGRKYPHLYLGGKVAVKKNKGYVKTDIPMERKIESGITKQESRSASKEAASVKNHDS